MKYSGLNAGLDYAGVLFGIQTHIMLCQRFWIYLPFSNLL